MVADHSDWDLIVVTRARVGDTYNRRCIRYIKPRHAWAGLVYSDLRYDIRS